MEPPIYFYYQLENFYQNHRRYVKSKDKFQLENGTPYQNDDFYTFSEDCSPIMTLADLGND